MIARATFEPYRRALDANAGMAEAELSSLWGGPLAGLPASGLGSALDELLPALAAKYGDRAAAVAAEFYMRVRAEQGVAGAYDAVPLTGVAPGDVAAASRSALSASTGREGLASSLAGQLVRHVNQAADDTIVGNARRDPAHPRWALVPHAGACGFCLMIASRGFGYTASGRVARHNRCRCATVADFDRASPSLEGHDVGPLAALYDRAREEASGAAWDGWLALDPADRERYARRGGYDAFKRNRIAAAMGRMRAGGSQS